MLTNEHIRMYCIYCMHYDLMHCACFLNEACTDGDRFYDKNGGEDERCEQLCVQR